MELPFLAGFLAVGIVFTGCSNQTSGGSTTAAAQESGTTAASATTESVSAVTTSAAVETSVSVSETVVGNDQLEVQLLGYVSEHGDWEPDKTIISTMRKIMIHIIIAVLIMVIVNMSVMWIRLPVK